MSVEENKKIAAAFFENLSSGNGAAVMNALADTATWWLAGNFPQAGTKTKKEFAELVGSLGPKIDGPLTVKPIGVTAEGDRVAVEAESHAKMKMARSIRTNTTSCSKSETARFRKSRSISTRRTPSKSSSAKAYSAKNRPIKTAGV
jgi:ketosteroid isomerase-like protein